MSDYDALPVLYRKLCLWYEWYDRCKWQVLMMTGLFKNITFKEIYCILHAKCKDNAVKVSLRSKCLGLSTRRTRLDEVT